MRHERVKIRRDERTVVSRALPPWEIPILEFLFGDGNVERSDEFVQTEHDYPDVHMEFERLEGAYGSDPASDIPLVASIYGQKSVGRKNLAKAIEEAKEDDLLAAEDAKVNEKAKPKKAPARRATKEDRDSLLS